MILNEEELKRILSHLNPVKFNGSEFQISCPECGGRECFISINVKNHPFGCFRAKACIPLTGNIYTLKKYGIFFKKEDKTTSNFEKRSLKVFSQQSNEVILPNVNMPLGFKKVNKLDYLDSRGFTKRDYEYWEVGRTPIGLMKKYVIFPITNNSERKAYVARALSNDTQPKYKNSVSEFASLLGGSDKFDNCRTVILVEGIFDVINITRLLDLYDSDSLRSVCTFGAKISDNQISILKEKHIKQLILMFDNDVIRKIKPIAFELALHFDVKIAMLEGEDIDAGNCKEEHILKALDNLYSPLGFYLQKD